MAPTLETGRLRLRGHRVEDFPACAAMWGDSEVTRYIGGKPATPEETWSRLLRYAGHWALLGFGYWVIEDKATGNFVGEVGFADYKRGLNPRLIDTPEVGWVIASACKGHGYATEAVCAVAAWGDTNFKSPRTACIIHQENAASIRVAEKCGYRLAHPVEYHARPVLLFVR